MKTKWPDRDWYGNYSSADWSRYERARAEAAIERLELLAAELRNIRDMERYDQDGIWYPMTTGTEMSERAGEALLAIGPIPESVSTGENQHE